MDVYLMEKFKTSRLNKKLNGVINSILSVAILVEKNKRGEQGERVFHTNQSPLLSRPGSPLDFRRYSGTLR